MNLEKRSTPSLDQAALERVLKRTIELQAASRPTTADTLNEEQLQQIAREMGLEPAHLQRALAEERAGLKPQSQAKEGFLAKVLGPEILQAGRAINADPPDILDGAARWLEQGEGLQIVKKTSDHLLAEPQKGALGMLKSWFVRGSGDLRQAQAVSVRAELCDAEQSMVGLHADVKQNRQNLKGQLAATLTIGLVATMVLAVSLDFAALLVLFPILGGAWATQANHKRQMQKIQTALERTLDRLEKESQDGPSSLTEGAKRLGSQVRLLSDAFIEAIQRPQPPKRQ